MLNFVIHAITHILGRPASASLLKKIQAVDPSDYLDETELSQLQPRVDRVRRRRMIACCVTVVLSVAIVVIGLYVFVVRTELTPLDPILDQRTPFRRLVSPFFGLLIGGLLSILIGRMIVRMEFGDSSELFWRYLATRTRLDARRVHKWGFLIGVPLVGVMLVLLLNGGKVVDARGILESSGIVSSVVRKYNDVATILVYSRVDAPAGIVTRDNICIKLKNSEEVRIDYAKDEVGDPPVWDVARYISEKSGVPVTLGDIRPR